MKRKILAFVLTSILCLSLAIPGFAASSKVHPSVEASLAKYTDDSTALELGYSAYRAIWKTETTEISMIMYNFGDGIQTTIAYTDPNHEEVKNTSGL